MSVHFDPWRRIYDLYSFDAPYDLEPTAFPESLRNYEETIDSHKNSRPADIEDKEDEFGGLDLTFEEAEQGRHFFSPDLKFISEQGRTSGEQPSPSPVLGATLSQRKKLLKERIEELIADIHKREKLEGQMLEKADVEGAGLEFLLGQVRTWSLGNYPSVDMRRTNLEREILALKKAGWDEQLRCWRDLVMLKKELREALEEYHLILSVEGL
jgi:hypothetical protein